MDSVTLFLGGKATRAWTDLYVVSRAGVCGALYPSRLYTSIIWYCHTWEALPIISVTGIWKPLIYESSYNDFFCDNLHLASNLIMRLVQMKSEVVLGEGVPSDCWCRHLIDASAYGAPLPSTRWAASGVTAPPWPWCLYLTSIYRVLMLSCGAECVEDTWW
jgi:hypothetical protein